MPLSVALREARSRWAMFARPAKQPDVEARKRHPGKPGTKPARHILMLAHTHYEEDARVRREAEALIGAGYSVEVLALHHDGLPDDEAINGVVVRRLHVEHVQGRGFLGYLGEYLAFLIGAGIRASRPGRARPDVVQVHTLPDFLVLAALPLKLRRVPLVLDMHEAMPPFFRVRFRRQSTLVHAAARMAERLAVGLADRVITVNDTLADRLVRMGVDRAKITVIMNTPDPELFRVRPESRRSFMADGTLRLGYFGSLTPLYDVATIIRAVGLLAQQQDERTASGRLAVALEIYGRGDLANELQKIVGELGLASVVRFHGRVGLEDVPGLMDGIDIGLAPTRKDPYTEMSLSTKLFEVIAMGKPVVATRLPTVERYVGESVVAFYEAGDPASAAAAIKRVMDDASWRAGAAAAGRELLEVHGWARQAEAYLRLIDEVIAAHE